MFRFRPLVAVLIFLNTWSRTALSLPIENLSLPAVRRGEDSLFSDSDSDPDHANYEPKTSATHVDPPSYPTFNLALPNSQHTPSWSPLA